ncbi:DUF397 domain-containing protein [Streptomyces sp. NBC_01304]|uniref:DUF397 domain-containing protein n=1 Tax=Streptomyces sp. NBC_01304 TaxID=2903818 RepID=UPI002E0E348E|nr:DUF397 domain-containing protein [Streptomyces sp. NBC_01304]
MKNTEALAWFKSSYSGGSGGECLEVATCPAHADAVHIRDSKRPDGDTLTISPDAWSAFLTRVRD